MHVLNAFDTEALQAQAAKAQKLLTAVRNNDFVLSFLTRIGKNIKGRKQLWDCSSHKGWRQEGRSAWLPSLPPPGVPHPPPGLPWLQGNREVTSRETLGALVWPHCCMAPLGVSPAPAWAVSRCPGTTWIISPVIPHPRDSLEDSVKCVTVPARLLQNYSCQ